MTIRLAVVIMAVLLMGGLTGAAGVVTESDEKVGVIPAEDYALYDLVVTSKFLTSDTRLVVIERMTLLRLSPDQEGPERSEPFRNKSISMANCHRS